MKKKPLQGLVCFVETIDDNGSDVSKQNAENLIQLGAEIEDCLSERITHYICSNVSHKKIIAAKLLDIIVVTPEWVEECRQTQSKVPESNQTYSHSSSISFQDFMKDNQDLFGKTVPLPPPVNIPLPSFKEYQMPELPETKITRRRSERLCDLQDQESTGSDDSIPAVNNVQSSTKKTKNYQKKVSKHPEFIRNSSLEDTMKISTKDNLPIAYGNESPEAIIANWKANLATDLVLDGNGPSAERKSGFFLKKQPNYTQRQQKQRKGPSQSQPQPQDSPKKRGRPKTTQNPSQVIMVEDDDDDDDEEDTDSSSSVEASDLRTNSRNSNNTNQSRRGRRGKDEDDEEAEVSDRRRGRRRQPSQRSTSRRSNDSVSVEVLSSDSMPLTKETRTTRRGRPKRVHSESSGEEEQSTMPNGRVVTITQKEPNSNKDNKAPSLPDLQKATKSSSSSSKQSKSAVQRTGPVILALTGFNKKDGDLHTMQKVIQSFLQTIQTNANHDDVPLPAPSMPISEKDLSSPFYIKPFERNVHVLEDDSSYDLPFTHVIVSKTNNSRTLRILFALAKGIPIIKEEWIYDCLCHGCWTNPLSFRFERYQQLDLTMNHIFADRLFCVLHSTKPETSLLIQLLEAAGGRTTVNLLPAQTSTLLPGDKISLFVCGDRGDLKEWLLQKKLKRQAKENREILQFQQLSMQGTQIVTSKYLCNILEEQRFRYALMKNGESIPGKDVENFLQELKKERLSPIEIDQDSDASRGGRRLRRRKGSTPVIINVEEDNNSVNTDDLGYDYEDNPVKPMTTNRTEISPMRRKYQRRKAIEEQSYRIAVGDQDVSDEELKSIRNKRKKQLSQDNEEEADNEDETNHQARKRARGNNQEPVSPRADSASGEKNEVEGNGFTNNMFQASPSRRPGRKYSKFASPAQSNNLMSTLTDANEIISRSITNAQSNTTTTEDLTTIGMETISLVPPKIQFDRKEFQKHLSSSIPTFQKTFSQVFAPHSHPKNLQSMQLIFSDGVVKSLVDLLGGKNEELRKMNQDYSEREGEEEEERVSKEKKVLTPAKSLRSIASPTLSAKKSSILSPIRPISTPSIRRLTEPEDLDLSKTTLSIHHRHHPDVRKVHDDDENDDDDEEQDSEESEMEEENDEDDDVLMHSNVELFDTLPEEFTQGLDGEEMMEIDDSNLPPLSPPLQLRSNPASNNTSAMKQQQQRERNLSMLKYPPLSLIPPASMASSAATSPPIPSPSVAQQQQQQQPTVTTPSFTPVQPTISTPRAATIFSRAASAIVSFFSSGGIDQNSQSYQTFQSIPIQSAQSQPQSTTTFPLSSLADTKETTSVTAGSNPSSATKKDVVYDKNNSLIYGSSPYFSSQQPDFTPNHSNTTSANLTIGRREIIQLNNANSEKKPYHTQPLYPAPSSLLSSVPIARNTNTNASTASAFSSGNNSNNNSSYHQSPSSDTSTDNQSVSPPLPSNSTLKASSSSQHLPPISIPAKREFASTPKSSATSSSTVKGKIEAEDRTIFTQQAADSLLLLSSMKTGVSSVPVQQKKTAEQPSPAELFTETGGESVPSLPEQHQQQTPKTKTFSNKKAPNSPPLAMFGIPTIKAHLPPPRSRSTTTETLTSSTANSSNTKKTKEETPTTTAEPVVTSKKAAAVAPATNSATDEEIVGKRTRKPAKKYSDDDEEGRKKAILSSIREQERIQKHPTQKQPQPKQQPKQQSSAPSYYSAINKNDRSSSSRDYSNSQINHKSRPGSNDYYAHEADDPPREAPRDRRDPPFSNPSSYLNGTNAGYANNNAKSTSSFLQNTNNRIFASRQKDNRDEYDDLINSPVRDPFDEHPSKHGGSGGRYGSSSAASSYHNRSSSSGGRDVRDGRESRGGGGYEDDRYNSHYHGSSSRSRSNSGYRHYHHSSDRERDRDRDREDERMGSGSGRGRKGRQNSYLSAEFDVARY